MRVWFWAAVTFLAISSNAPICLAQAVSKANAKPSHRSAKTVAAKSVGVVVGAERRFVLQNGNPNGSTIDLTPYLASYHFIGGEVGLMGAYRLLSRGFIPPINNSVSIEIGMHRSRWSPWGVGHNQFGVSGGMRWDFHLSKTWTPYIGTGVIITQSWFDGATNVSGDLNLGSKIGALLHLNSSLAMRAEYAGDTNAFRIGSTLMF
jgi:hypothetical protein